MTQRFVLSTLHRMSELFNTNLAGKTALVCGASAGIGEATCRVLAHLGARVVAVARNQENLDRVVKSLSGKAAHRGISIDVNDHKALRELVSAEGFDVVINNSGGPKGGPLLDARPEEFIATFHQHLLTAQLLAQLAIPGMRERKYGRIVNIISTSVRTPLPNLGVSNTIRAAMASWAKTLSLEVAADGITVNSVLPGFTKTGRLENLLQAGAAKVGKTNEDLANDWKNTIPARRFGEPEEVANAVAFYATPAAAYITGTVLAVDGGRTPAY